MGDGKHSGTTSEASKDIPSSLVLPEVLHYLHSEWGLQLPDLCRALLTHPAACLLGSVADDIVPSRRALKSIGVRVLSDVPIMAKRSPLALLSPSLAANVAPLSSALHEVLRVPQSKCERLVVRHPEVVTVRPAAEECRRVRERLMGLGLTGSKVARVVQASPQILCRTNRELQQVRWL